MPYRPVSASPMAHFIPNDRIHPPPHKDEKDWVKNQLKDKDGNEGNILIEKVPNLLGSHISSDLKIVYTRSRPLSTQILRQ